MADLLKRGPRAGAIVGIVAVVAAAWAVRVIFLPAGGLEFVPQVAWGGSGDAPGRFAGPIGVAVGPAGDVYVTDSGNDRIQRFRPDGTLVAVWGGTGDGLGQLRRPMHASFGAEGNLYVAEYLNDRIQVFTPEGVALRAVGDGGTGPGEFDSPGGVAVAPAGDLYVADFYNHRVQHLRADGSFAGLLGRSGRVWDGALHYPTDVALLPDGDVVVADAYNNRVQVFAGDGRVRARWGGPLGAGVPGRWRGWFRVATGVGVDARGRVYVADFYNDRVQVFTAAGTFLGAFGGHGAQAGRFDRPTDVAVAADGTIYVVDFGNDRVQVFGEETP